MINFAVRICRKQDTDHCCTVVFFSTLGEAWAQLKKSLADEAEVHLKFSSKVNYSFFLLQKYLPCN